MSPRDRSTPPLAGPGFQDDRFVIANRPSVLDTLGSTDAEPAPAPHPRIGQRYETIRDLARGGMGEIRLVKDQDLDRTVVMKTLRPELLHSPALRLSLVREARSAGKLDHPGIVSILDLGMAESGEMFFTMPYVQGQTLLEIIEDLLAGDLKAHHRFSFPERLQIIMKICDAVGHAHASGILHRDIKPTNVMVGRFGEVLVMDWGLARALADPSAAGRWIAGTPGYMAPEQARGETAALSPRTDVYGIGALMYHLFALQPPYRDLADGAPATVQTTAVPPADSVPAPRQERVPREIALIIQRAMAPEPALRFASVQALRAEVLRYEDGQAPIVCVHTGMKRTLREMGRLVDRVGTLVVIALVALVVAPWMLAVFWVLF